MTRQHNFVNRFAIRYTGRGPVDRREGFTLTELLVTCALVTVLMLACAQIFSIASKTIGGGQAINAAVRDAQAAQAVFARDFSAAAPATVSPVMYIVSDRQYAFRNSNDSLSDTDGNIASADFDGDGNEETLSQAIYNFRNHRIDTVGFFAIDKYARQTGNGNALIIADASREAWIWYGHLTLANNDTSPTYYGPGDNHVSATNRNDNNRFATQWILGRVAVLMKDPSTINGGSAVAIPYGNGDLRPLAFRTTSSQPNDALLNFEYDMAAVTLAQFKQDVLNVSSPLSHMIFEDAGSTRVGRIRANPFQVRPLDAQKVAQQVPIFVPACTQFIVEFAGDFLEQNPSTGAVEDVNSNGTVFESDGQIDYVPGTGQVRWYGMPRDTNGNGIISASDGDVVPVRDVAGGTAPVFERVLPTTSALSNYSNSGVTLSRYIAAWGPTDLNRPKMIRITLVIDRPEAEGRLLEGQSFEYVFNVGY
jgi:type II secretory pathway pseudopilin PulG